MPEITFTIELPTGETKHCYSPSSVILKYFTKGEVLPVAEFVERSRSALTAASERVRAKFGFHCTAAAAQLADIESYTRSLPPKAPIRILDI